MLLDNKFMNYDLNLNEYYITINGVVNHTPYSSDDLARILGGNLQSTLKNISRSVYRFIYNARQGVGNAAHKRFMQRKIYDNKNGEALSLMYAIIEAVKGAIESGMDLNAYINEPKEALPLTVKEELKSSELYDRSEKLESVIIEIPYTNEEILRWHNAT